MIRAEGKAQNAIEGTYVQVSFQNVVGSPRYEALGCNLAIGRIGKKDEWDFRDRKVKRANGRGWIRLEERKGEKRDIGMEITESVGKGGRSGDKEQLESLPGIRAKRSQRGICIRETIFSKEDTEDCSTHERHPLSSAKHTWCTEEGRRRPSNRHADRSATEKGY